MDIKLLNQQLVSYGIENVLAHLGVEYTLQAKTIHTGSIAGEKGQSLSFTRDGHFAGRWKDYQTHAEGDLLEFWTQNRGLSKPEAYKEVCSFLNIDPNNSSSIKTAQAPKREEPPAQPEEFTEITQKVDLTLMKELQLRLSQNTSAAGWLNARGLTDETIKHFSLGLSKKYKTTEGPASENALIFPLINSKGVKVKRWLFYNIPGITSNPISKNGWSKGRATLYFNTKKKKSHKWIFFCEGIKDLWVLHQNIKDTYLFDQLLLASSTHGSVIPSGMKEFLNETFERAYLGQDNDEAGEKTVEKWLETEATDFYRVAVPKPIGKDWTDFFKKQPFKDFEKIFTSALCVYSKNTPKVQIKEPTLASTAKVKQQTPILTNIEFGYSSINNKCYQLFKPLPGQAINDFKIVGPEENEILATDFFEIKEDTQEVYFAIRNDKKTVGVKKGEENSYILSDGTILKTEKQLKRNEFSTWSNDSIKDYLLGNFVPRKSEALIADIADLIKSQVWLPDSKDYARLGALILASYAQDLFDESITVYLKSPGPYCGKTALSWLLNDLSPNSLRVRPLSIFKMMTAINKLNGTLIICDLDSHLKENERDPFLKDFLSFLNQKYLSKNSTLNYLNSETLTPIKLNLFGTKYIFLPTSLRTYLFTNQTFVVNMEQNVNFKKTPASLDINQLRDEMHCWAFLNAGEIRKNYLEKIKKGEKNAAIKSIKI